MQPVQPAPQTVCLNMQPYDAQGKEMDPTTGYPPEQGLAVQGHRDHVLWSLFNFFFFNFCCLGFLALVFSVKSRDRKVVGDPDGAASYGRTAKYLNIALTTLGILVILSAIIVVIVMFSFTYSYVVGYKEGRIPYH